VRSKEPRIEHTPCLARASLGNARRAAAVFHVRYPSVGAMRPAAAAPGAVVFAGAVVGFGHGAAAAATAGVSAHATVRVGGRGRRGNRGRRGRGARRRLERSLRTGRSGYAGGSGRLPEARLAVLSQRLVHNARAASCATRRERTGWSRGPFRLTNWRPFPRQRAGFAERKTSLNGLVRSYGPIKIGLQNSHLGQQMQRSRQNDCQCQARDGGVGGFILIHLWVPLTVELGKLGYSRGAIE
jgi:hypothetical protein